MKSVSYNGYTLTKEYIRERITTDDNALIRGMLAIYAYQTADEQRAQVTKYENGVGFNGADSTILSSFCEQYNRKGFLSTKQLNIARRKMAKYAKQLLHISAAKVANA